MKNNMVMILAVGGGGFLAYWYMTNYGSGGAVADGFTSYWDEWFGAATGTTPPANQVTSGDGGSGGGTTTTTPTTDTGGTNVSSVRAQMLAQAAGNANMNDQGKMDAHNWNFYRNQIDPPALSGEEFGAAFPNGQDTVLITVDEFLTAVHGTSGLGYVTPSATRASIPSMSFGGGGFGKGMRGMSSMASKRNSGVTIQ
jgi:hypothetical protein